MSYSVAFDRKALETFRQLDFNLQEDVLDEVDALAAAADALPIRSLPSTQIHNLFRERAGVGHYVFRTLDYDSTQRVLAVTRLGYVARPSAR